MMGKGKLFQIIDSLCSIVVVLGMYGCCQSDEVDNRLNVADSLMECHPDSALIILDGVDDSELCHSRIRARHALLKSMALDKNGIDTTTFDVLQPAIDYYLTKGTADEKLRTYYYKGRIHDNASEDDLAMETYLTALGNCDGITDSLTLARLLVAQGREFYKQYRIKDFTKNNLQAASAYGGEGQLSQRLQCLKRALSGVIILFDKSMADSIYDLCQSLVTDNPSLKPSMSKMSLMYAIQFGNEESIAKTLEGVQSNDVAEDMKMNIARGYTKIGEPEIGLQYLKEAKVSSDHILDSLTYWSVKTTILENLGEDRQALDAYRNYSRVLEVYHDQLFSNELLFSEKKHEMELENMATIQKRDRMIKWILVGTAVLLIITLLIYYRYRMNKNGRLLAERNAENLQLEGEKQRLLAEKLDAEGRELLQKNETLRIEEERQRLLAENLESERARLQLEAENLHHKIEEMEGEQTQLKELLDSQETLSEEARQLIRERIGLLNGLIAQALTEQESYGKEFKNYIAKIKKDKKGFQESLVKLFETTHPDFMAYLRKHDLTERELQYACLYALGMRGKEIGTYLDLARHYNISTEVRRKFGLDPNDRNLGPFLQEKLRKR